MSSPMMRRLDARLMAVLALGAALSTSIGCERSAAGLTEWTPADHDHQTEPRQRHNMPTQGQRANPRSAPTQRSQVIDVTWAKQCASCHGRRGKGDGPSSTMVKARDLTNPDFQATLSDEQIAKVIREGKDKMPAFNLPDSIIEGLVQHVRGLVRKRPSPGEDDAERGDEAEEQEAPAAAPNAPASASSPPAPSPAAEQPAADTKPQEPTPPPRAATPPTRAPSAAPSAPHP
jgi:cytochrome c oxidase cbb3-type subunit 3